MNLFVEKCESRIFAYLTALTFDPPLPLRMVHIVHSSTGDPTPTHKTPAHAQRRLFGSGHLLQVYQLITEEMSLEGCANSHERFSI